MDIHKFEKSDISLIHGLIPPGWETMLPTLEFYSISEFCFPIKIVKENKIIGIGTTIIHNDVAWLAHIVVHPEFRNQSIGKLITQTLIDYSYAKGCDTIYLIATELGAPVYNKLGFEIETEYVYFKLWEKSILVQDQQNIFEFNEEFTKQISLLDREVSGEERLFHLQSHFENSFIYFYDNEVKGYYLPSFSNGLIIAKDKIAGQALMKLRTVTFDFSAFPIENINALEFAENNNFIEVRKDKRMRFGKQRIWQPANIYNRIGGNLG